MEVVSEKRGSMKSKLIMSFYRAAKPPPATTVKPPPALLVKATSFRNDDCASPRSDDGYSHGPDGGGGDRFVDKKASSFISHVKERLRLEELDLMMKD